MRVIATLTHVDMIIRVDWLLGAQFSAEQFDSTIGDDLFVIIGMEVWSKCQCVAHLIYVHVALSATSGLEHDEGEVVDKLSGNDLRDKVSERGRRRKG